MDRLPGRVDDGARLPGRVRPARQRAVRVAAAVPAVPGAVPPLAAAAVRPLAARRRRLVAAAPRPAGAARVLDLAGVLQPRARSGSRSRSSTRSCSTCWCGCCCWRSAAGGPRQPLRLRGPGLVAGRSRSIFLVGFRVGLNVTNSNVIDVGYAGVIGADKLLHGQHAVRRTGRRTTPAATRTDRSTTTPTSRSAAIFGWSGTWDDLPAAHAAAIAFDLLTLLGLFLLGRRIRGPDARGRARLRVGGLSVHALVAQLEQQRHARRRC